MSVFRLSQAKVVGVLMSQKDSIVRVALAKRLATRWLAANAEAEYQLVVYGGFGNIHNLPGLLRSFRDSKVRLGTSSPIRDLVVTSSTDKISLRSHDKGALVQLDAWLLSKGCETTGIW